MVDFEKLYAENQRLVFGYLCRLSKNESLAEELTQETFFRAYMNLSSLRKEESAPSWLSSPSTDACYLLFKIPSFSFITPYCSGFFFGGRGPIN